jgi:hypothetical protein
VAALLAGLGVVCTVMGIAFIWHVRSGEKQTGKDDEVETADDEPVAAPANA